MRTSLKHGQKKMDEKIVYFAGAIRGDRVMAGLMPELVGFIKNLGATVLTEHVAKREPIEAFAKAIGKEKESLRAEDIEKQDIKWLDQATHVIAEISGASTGTGREIEYARNKHNFAKVPAKVLCLYHSGREFEASPMIRGMTIEKYPNVEVRKYNDTDEAKSIIKEFLEK